MSRMDPEGPVARLAAFLEKCGGAVRQSGKETVFRCPCYARHTHGDKKPSGNVCIGDDGRLLVTCRAGCPTEDVVAAIGWTLADLMPAQKREVLQERPKEQTYRSAAEVARALARSRKGKLIEFYTYIVQGREVGLVARVLLPDGSKEMPQGRCKDGVWTRKGLPKPIPLFNVDAVFAAPDQPVQIHEGEKKTQLAAKLGFTATSCAMGAGKAHFTDLSPLADRVVHLFPDNDVLGKEHMQDVARLAYSAGAAEVWLVSLPHLPVKGDIVDFHQQRQKAGINDERIADELRDAIARAEPMPRPVPAAPDADLADDDGDALPAPFPLEALPDMVREMVVGGARAQNVDVTFWAVPAISILAGCINGARFVQVKRGWREPGVLWSMLIAPSGAGKSPGQRTLLQPVRKRDRQLREQSALELEEHKAQCALVKKGDIPPPLPPFRCCHVSDVTIEALATRLRDNPRGLLLAVDELGAWLRSHTRYKAGGRGSDEQQWLQMHAAEAVTIDRQAAPPIFVPSGGVSVVGTIQPQIAAQLLGHEQRASGLAARLLLAMPPLSPALWSDATVDPAVERNWNRLVDSLLDLTYDPDEPRALRLSAAATALYREWHNRMALMSFEAGTRKEHDIASALTKVRGVAPRIALVLALAREAERGLAEVLNEVGPESMRGGIEIADWFAAEAPRIYAELGSGISKSKPTVREKDSLIAMADRLDEAIHSKGSVTMRDVHEITGRRESAEFLRAALAIVVARGRATPIRRAGPRGGRPAEIWEAKR